MRYQTGYVGVVDYRKHVTMPIRDLANDGKIVCLVDVYGWTGKDICKIPGGSDPLVAAVKRLGLDPIRYQATIWDTPL